MPICPASGASSATSAPISASSAARSSRSTTASGNALRACGPARAAAGVRATLQRQTEIGHAETRRIKVRQELDPATAIIPRSAAPRTAFCSRGYQRGRQETINTVTEELMLARAGYWLAPPSSRSPAGSRTTANGRAGAQGSAAPRRREGFALLRADLPPRATVAACRTGSPAISSSKSLFPEARDDRRSMRWRAESFRRRCSANAATGSNLARRPG